MKKMNMVSTKNINVFTVIIIIIVNNARNSTANGKYNLYINLNLDYIKILED